MKFSMSHLFFECEPEIFTCENPPKWLVGKSFSWFWEGYVMKLEVGSHVNTDFRRITRIS
jgi:hypothetical protein